MHTMQYYTVIQQAAVAAPQQYRIGALIVVCQHWINKTRDVGRGWIAQHAVAVTNKASCLGQHMTGRAAAGSS